MVDSVFVPFVNRRHHLTRQDETGVYLPSTPPFLAGFQVHYEGLEEGDVLRFVQCKALASGVKDRGKHRGQGYTGKVGPIIQNDQQKLLVMGYESIEYRELDRLFSSSSSSMRCQNPGPP